MWCIRKEVSVFICLAPEEDYPSFLFIFSFFFLSFFFFFFSLPRTCQKTRQVLVR